MAKREMARHEPCRQIDLPLPVESIEQSDAELLGIGRQIVRPLVAIIARDSGRRHVEITCEVSVHSGADASRLAGKARDVFAPMRNASYGPAHYLKRWVLLFAGISWCRFRSKHRATTIQMRVMKFIADEFLGGRAAGMALEPAGLLVEPPFLSFQTC